MSIKVSSSFTEIPADRLKAACKLYLDARAARIKEARAVLIDKEMRKPWPFRPQNRESARKRLMSASIFTEWFFIELIGGESAIRVEELEALANMANSKGSVFLTAQDAHILWMYIPCREMEECGEER